MSDQDTRAIQIPTTIEGAMAALGGIERLLTAKGWERSAIVYAFTRDGGQGQYQQEQKPNIRFLTSGEFAGLSINGLQDADTVRKYRDHWKQAIVDGYAVHVEPGDSVELPDPKQHRFPPIGNSQGWRGKGANNAPPQEKAELVAHLLSDPEVAKAAEETIIETVAKSPRLTARTYGRAEELRPEPAKRERDPAVEANLAIYAMGAKAVVQAKALQADASAMIAWIQNRDFLTDIDREAIAGNIKNLREAAEVLLRYASDIDLAIRGESPASESWIDALLERS